jgi:hypothetical protein
MASNLYKKTEAYSKWLEVIKKHLGQGKHLGEKFGTLIMLLILDYVLVYYFIFLLFIV